MICQNQIHKKVRTFELDVPSEIHSVFIEAEALEQILVNLLINAIQALDKPESRVRIAMGQRKNSPETLILEVGDNGAGMDAETVEKIFEPFFTTKEKGVGTGLGLYICKNIAEELNGEIQVESRPGEGTTMRILVRTGTEDSHMEKGEEKRP